MSSFEKMVSYYRGVVEDTKKMRSLDSVSKFFMKRMKIESLEEAIKEDTDKVCQIVDYVAKELGIQRPTEVQKSGILSRICEIKEVEYKVMTGISSGEIPDVVYVEVCGKKFFVSEDTKLERVTEV